jgi:hypothetical protein
MHIKTSYAPFDKLRVRDFKSETAIIAVVMILTKRFSPLLLLVVALCVLVCNSPSQAQTKDKPSTAKVSQLFPARRRRI